MRRRSPPGWRTRGTLPARAETATSVSFDLTPAVSRYRRSVRIVVALGLTLSALLTLEALYELFFSAASLLNSELVVIALAFAASLAAVSLIGNIRGPVRLSISPSGFVFEFLNGRSQEYSWTDPDLRLRFWDVRFIPYALVHPDKMGWTVSVSLHPVLHRVVPLTIPAYEGLLRAAEARDLRVAPSDWSEATNGKRRVTMSGVQGAAGAFDD